ncbi:MAG: 4Fe-4S cluster-binding domain-containing protein [Candidatus Omnitrophica bacterium]|nr:4Fe-4S cluster-binding domain-containing protein [Candidatus Omnitrophota bacterium]
MQQIKRLIRKFLSQPISLIRLSENSTPWISLFVTARCDLNCTECIMGNLKSAAQGYQMSPDEIKRFIKTSESSRYAFNIILTGGEPLHWKHLDEGVQLLRGSSCCKSLHLFTNALNIKGLNDQTGNSFDRIRISRYPRNEKNIEELIRRFPAKVEIVDRTAFWKTPLSRMPNVLPAVCCNSEVFFFNNKIYACPHSASIALRHRTTVTLYTPLKKGFLKRLPAIRKKQEYDICAFCISNMKVRNQAELVKNP